jgi:DNA-binding XRE family transcriptional regulator
MNFDEKSYSELIVKENCGEKLKAARATSMITKRDFSKIVGISEATISRIESGKTKPTLKFLTRLLAICYIGHIKFSSLSEDEKKQFEHYSLSNSIFILPEVKIFSSVGLARGLAAIGGFKGTLELPKIITLISFGMGDAIKMICKLNKLKLVDTGDNFTIQNELNK